MVMYWPGMDDAIQEMVDNCQICLRHRHAQQKEPMVPHSIPAGPFLKVGMDIMTCNGRDYLVIVDYYSKYPELALLQDKTAGCVISHAKSVFARHGIPEEIVSDNMPFGSREFRDFAKSWGIILTTSSPGYPQSNGQAERCVQTLKRLLKKASEDGRDPYIALLEYRSTPVAGMQLAPSQLLMSRILRSKLPVCHELLKPKVTPGHSSLLHCQRVQKEYYDRNANPLHPLKEGDVVRVVREGKWEPAIVTKQEQQPRSYKVQYEGGVLRRNRRHLLATGERPPVFMPDARDDAPLQTQQPEQDPVSCHQPVQDQGQLHQPTVTDERGPEEKQSQTMCSRSGRRVKMPERYKDFVCS